MNKLSQSFTIKSWSDEDKPREKLRDKGRLALSNAELIAILIGSGNRHESAVDLAKRILQSVNHNLSALGKLDLDELKSFHGIGEAKAISIAAALELGRRRRYEDAQHLKKFSSSRAVFELMQPIIGDLGHEEFWVLYLNNSNTLIQKNQLSKGGITSTIVDTRLLLKTALRIGAVGLILAHNHPSGNFNPSGSDKQLTKKLKLASESLDIKVLDHVIITEKAYFSFADEALL